MSHAQSPSPFYIPVDLGSTALLLADIQDEITSRFPPAAIDRFVTDVLHLLTLFRTEINNRRANPSPNLNIPYDNVPLIIHHIFPTGINSNAFISPYNKLGRWFNALDLDASRTDPNHPSYSICEKLRPKGDIWGSRDEIIIPKLTAGCFSSSELQGYLRARGIKHVILCGLTTAGAILGSARLGADLDFHVVVPRESVMDDEEEVNDFLLERILPRFVDVVGLGDVEELFESGS